VHAWQKGMTMMHDGLSFMNALFMLTRKQGRRMRILKWLLDEIVVNKENISSTVQAMNMIYDIPIHSKVRHKTILGRIQRSWAWG